MGMENVLPGSYGGGNVVTLLRGKDPKTQRIPNVFFQSFLFF